MEINKIYNECCLETMGRMPDGFVDMVICSPPYWGLRDYGHDGQLGLEPTYQEYIDKLVDIFDKVKRVLKNTGSCWVNIGDSYFGSGQGGGDTGFSKERHKKELLQYKTDSIKRPSQNYKSQAKSLAGIPERFAIAMTDNGWIRRNTIIWEKPNCMPSSAIDRFTVDFEYLYFFTKNPQYYFEQQFDEYTAPLNRWGGARYNEVEETKYNEQGEAFIRVSYNRAGKESRPNEQGRNKRCVWKIPTHPYPDAHFATYPENLCETPIKAGCPSHICKKCGKARENIYTWDFKGDSNKRGARVHGKNQGQSSLPSDAGTSNKQFKGYTDCGCNAGFEPGIVYDPFIGAGTTAKKALELGRKFIGSELSSQYCDIGDRRIKQDLAQGRFSLNIAKNVVDK